jgi:hypothetical protein
MTIAGGTLTGNQAVNGGGVALFGNGKLLIRSGTTISGNHATSRGGGVAVFNSASVTRIGTGGEITGNSAPQFPDEYREEK